MERTHGTDADLLSEAWQKGFETLVRLQSEMESLAGGRPLDLAEGTRYLARLLASGLARFDGRGSTAIDYATPRIGGFNPDYRFGHAKLDPAGAYRIRGRLNDVQRLAIGSYPGGLGNFQPVGYLAKDQIACDAEGRFEVRIADARPEPEPAPAVPVSWLPSSAETTALMVRQLLLRATDRPAELVLERVDAAPAGVPSRAVLDARRQRAQMDAALLFVAGAAGQFFRWTRIFSQNPNAIADVPTELEAEVKADPDTFYAIGYFDLAEGGSLDIRFTPPACDYWGLAVTNHWLEPIEHGALRTHYNHATAERDPQGEVCLTIDPDADTDTGEVPSRPNIVHTAGHRNGAIFFRVIGARNNEVPLPDCRVRSGVRDDATSQRGIMNRPG